MEFISSIFDKYGLFATLFIIFLEYACFPLSSEIVLPALGALARARELSFFILLLLGAYRFRIMFICSCWIDPFVTIKSIFILKMSSSTVALKSVFFLIIV